MKKIPFYIVILTSVFACHQSKKEIKVAQYYSEVQTDSLIESIKRGKEIYMDMCVTCHLSNGEGVANVFPPLAKSDYLLQKREESIRAIKYGLQGKIVVNGVTYNQIMSPLGLDDSEVADVMNYSLNMWGNKSDKMVTEAEVNSISKDQK